MTTPFIPADTQHEHPHWQSATAAIRTAAPRSQYGENSEALYLSSSFVHPDAATAARRFAGEEEAFIYSRFSNPTVASMEMRLAAMEGAEGHTSYSAS